MFLMLQNARFINLFNLIYNLISEKYFLIRIENNIFTVHITTYNLFIFLFQMLDQILEIATEELQK